ncbi:MAG TPA: type II toxin-antitoxin system VapC family toxin [Blastocatellia bacterium]|nr:type II toxin-antitoxin system VapC family toxin [Blastocatellia bacterium]HMV86352.1 type II toxin-antitoxin system VapC family toxin [Blastocatellia bacterium]HMX25116.1 type II toxin-antitoxin system VapC family toxin [Blastocatellia bacterium]HMY76721.1 type II toxin-antitoxin system VapC family toxin [Blastocatellia bacterium]HMZ17578.1 type II toxin-antitoxin system VapC family toxin [Blastocatellia bacterium]
MVWYCDSSALVKRYVREKGCLWFRQEAGRHRIITSDLTVAEIASVLSRRKRRGTISEFEFNSGRGQFIRHLQTPHYDFLPAMRKITNQASVLIYRHPLAAYDAIHLATALDYLKVTGADSKQFYFITADVQLQRAAEAEGLQTENPNDHS